VVNSKQKFLEKKEEMDELILNKKKEINDSILDKKEEIDELKKEIYKSNKELYKLNQTISELNRTKSEVYWDIEKSYCKGMNIGIAMGLENCEKYLHAKNTRLYGNADDSNYIIYFMKIILVEEIDFKKRNEYYETTYGHIK
jgi:predicted nuclease with TOPRIM domain